MGANMMAVPIAHLSGGDITEGSADDCYRHAITKLSHLHFPTHAAAADRIIAMGEEPERVHMVGCPGIDRILATELLDREATFRAVGLAMAPRLIVVSWHPNTLGGDTAAETGELVTALADLDEAVALAMIGPNADPGAVAFDTIAVARRDGVDVAIIDTAGRLHTQDDLMAELAKVSRVISKQIPEAPHETLLTVDATTGQNGLRQARLFSEAVPVSGLVLTKLDGTAKGGIALAIAHELGIPVKLIGIGEQLDDLRPFDSDDFARALVTQ